MWRDPSGIVPEADNGPQGTNVRVGHKDNMTADKDSAFVSFQGVQKSYDGEILVVKDLNLDIAKVSNTSFTNTASAYFWLGILLFASTSGCFVQAETPSVI